MKRNLKCLVENADALKKVNPLDLSADQDLTIALMNLVAVENIAPNSQVGEMVRDIRKKLMARMIADENTQAREYLSQVANKMGVANKLLETGDKKTAYEMYDVAYESYVLFLATVYGISA